MRMVAAILAALALPAGAAQIAPDALGSISAPIVVLGEVHDNPVHHLNQARVVLALKPRALVFEMLTPEQAARALPGADAASLGKALGWEAGGWPDFAIYYPIFAAAPGAAIYGAALPRADVRRAMTEGPAAVFGADAARFGLGADLPPADQAAMEAEQMRAHCDALPPAMLPGMVAAQRLRDAAFARATLAALEETGGPVALITGSGHARTDRGVPAVLRAAAPDVAVVALGQVEAPAEADQPFDLWIVTDPSPRPDPCAAFR
ncbi:hypothetical protein CCR83_06665 [Rhodobacter veldkampii DSM 11550]|uniref:Haem-binding uptake Tiki superfamily ChaN domain-containing protein n=1 Tax=Phaeovulum veldkampii DSM 11550 TaxID=1185920 RepID=A0A2T4JIL4_9RHOB|nr:ChaN family lipoprotein [Phaeovulum veldkampii]MBK5946139.1 hypothetical protein [Phaeovulum veldkampii DSM 11550]NCU20420.1 hypothetical protein [Candidatus Falkowbacteria bacterium]PTE17703.1 hypothetical protein C5F46_07590 [Phaeovulum veldkampii DSM 11550]TDQ58229.1 putative iron-regulated protein [Phaeovulum veldkampii DSM 11550]